MSENEQQRDEQNGDGQKGAEQSGVLTKRLIWTALLSLFIYGIGIVITFDPSMYRPLVRAFGKAPLGLPVTVLAIVVQTVLFLPMPLVFYHFFRLLDLALNDGDYVGGRPGRFFAFAIRSCVNPQPSDRHFSSLVVMGGLLYTIALVVIWSMYSRK